MIEFKNVSYTYFNNYYPLFNFSYTFNECNYCLVGDIDLGNLTLIRLLAKLDTFYKGEILINGKSLKKTNYKKDFNVSYISRNPVFFNNKTVFKNLAYPLRSRGIKKDEINKIIQSTLSKFDWQDKINIKVKQLSYTERIILAIMRASTRNLDLLLVEDIFNIDLSFQNSSTTCDNKSNCGNNHVSTPNYTNEVNKQTFINLINDISATTKIIISQKDLELENYIKLDFPFQK